MKRFQFQKIKEFREAAGLTQGALGNIMGVHPQQISAWERERGKGLTVRTLFRLCKALGKDSNDFFKEV